MEVISLALDCSISYLFWPQFPGSLNLSSFSLGLWDSLVPFDLNPMAPFLVSPLSLGFLYSFLFSDQFFLSGVAQCLGPFWAQFHGPFSLKAFSLGLRNCFNLNPMVLGFFNPLPLLSSIPLHLQFKCFPCLWDWGIPWPLQSQSLVCGTVLCLWAQSLNFFKVNPLFLGFLPPLTIFSSFPAFGDDCISYPFGLQSHVFWGLMNQSLTPFKLNPLFLRFFNLLPFFRSGPCPPQSQCLVFGILGSLGPFDLWSLDFGIVQSLSPFELHPLAPFELYPLVLELFNPFVLTLISMVLGLFSPSILWTSILWPLQSQCLEIEGTKWLRLLSPFHFSSSIPQLWNCRDQILLLAHICSYNIQPRPASLIEADSSIEFALLIKHSWPPDSGKFMGCGDSQAGKQEYLCLFSGSSSLLFPVVFSGMRTCAVQWGK